MKGKEEKLYVDIPDMKFSELNIIIDKGVKERKSFFRELKEIFQKVGFHNVFHDKLHLSIIYLSISIPFLILLSGFSISSMRTFYEFVFTMPPIIALIGVLFSFYNSKENRVFDIEMTCKFNLYKISALRIFIFSLVSILISITGVVYIYINDNPIDVVRVSVLAVLGVFSFLTMFLYSLFELKGVLAKYFALVSWLIINFLLSISRNRFYENFLITAPIYVHLIISIVCIGLYIKALRKLINYKGDRRNF